MGVHMKKLNAAVIGLGFVGRSHVEALRRLGIVVCGAVAGTTEASREKAASLEVTLYDNIQAAAGDPKVDVIHVCTPNHLHYPMARVALEAGKHVICEKPLATSSKESGNLVKLARDRGVVGAVCYNLRYYPLCQQARALIRAGEIGIPRLIHGSYLQDWLFDDTDWNWRLVAERGGELRAVADIGTHWMDLACWLTGTAISEVSADLVTIHPIRHRPKGAIETFASKIKSTEGATAEEVASDDYGSVLLGFENGARGVFSVSQVSAGRKNRLWIEVDGSEKSISWNSEVPNRLWVGHRDEPNDEIIKDPALMLPEVRRYARYPGGHDEGYPDTFMGFFADVYDYIRTGDLRAPRVFADFGDGHAEALLCEAILDSHRTRCWRSVGTRLK
jgi:predicted dehydrogenase